jgi:hypothetical protein
MADATTSGACDRLAALQTATWRMYLRRHCAHRQVEDFCADGFDALTQCLLHDLPVDTPEQQNDIIKVRCSQRPVARCVLVRGCRCVSRRWCGAGLGSALRAHEGAAG